MNYVIMTTLLSFVSGVVGTGLGGFITVLVARPSARFMSAILAFAGGIMFSMVAFDILPAALDTGGLSIVLPGLALGLIMMMVIDLMVPSTQTTVNSKIKNNRSHYKRVGILIALGIAVHNFAEGLAIGSGYVVTKGLGLGVALVMAVHDVPEGMAMAAPLRLGGVRSGKVLSATILAGLPTALGGLIGGALGVLSKHVLVWCLSMASGAMLSIVADQLLPDAKNNSDGRSSSLGFGVGIILGILLAAASH